MTSKSFLLTIWEGGGNVPPALAVAAKLVKAGHDVRIMSDACNRPEAEGTGASFIAWTRAPSRPDKSPETDVIRDWDVASPVDGLKCVFERVMFGPAADYAADTAAEIARARPDLLVSNDMLFGSMAAAEANGVPFSLFCPNVSLYPMDGVPPMGPGFAPPRNEDERRLHAEIEAGNSAMFNEGLPDLNAAREALGLPPLAHVFDQLGRAEHILLGTARAFDFTPETVPPHIHYVGPQFHDLPTDDSWTSPFTEADGNDPLVLLSFSTTFQNQAAALQRVIAALGALPIRLLVTLGPALAAQTFEVPRNTRLIARAPHGKVMAEAKLVIAHGGHGTVMRALSRGCPLLIMPHGRDQNDNAARVAARGAGLMLDTAAADAIQIRDTVTRLLGEPGFAAEAARLGAQIRAEAEASPVLTLLESVARGRSAAQAAA